MRGPSATRGRNPACQYDPVDGFESRSVALGAVRVTEKIVPAGECFRTSQSGPGRYSVDVVASGRVQIEHVGRLTFLGPGDSVLVDSSRPVRYRHSAVRHVMVTFPQSLLLPAPDEVGVRLPGDHGAGALLSVFVRRMPEHIGEYGPVDGVRLGAVVVDLLSAVLTAGRRDPDHKQRALAARIQAFIEEHLGDRDLSPATIATAHHISVRYLYKLFQIEHTAVAEQIRRRRLERCRQDLCDPALRTRPIREIAARWGLPNPSHFSRLFRSAYDVSPAQYRSSQTGHTGDRHGQARGDQQRRQHEFE